MKIDYQALLDQAMLEVVRAVLSQTQTTGIAEEQSFYVSFRTDFAGVVLSQRIRQQYPKEITIVLQHQFKDLQVLQDRFSVNVAFGGIAETVEIPFASLTNFMDPVAEFNLQFRQKEHDIQFSVQQNAALKSEVIPLKQFKYNKIAASEVHKNQLLDNSEGKIISIDQFRRKRDSNKIK